MVSTVTSEVEMANLALARLKEPGISAFDTSSVASRWFSQNYMPARRSALARHRWNFAQTRTVLSPTGTAPAFEWSYAYNLPSDCMRLYPITRDGKRASALIDHEVEGNQILTNTGPALYIRYVKDIENEALFDPLFVEAFSFHLAAGVAHVLTSKNSLVQTMQQAFRDVLAEARRNDAMQGEPDPEPVSDYILTRYESWY